MLLLFVQTFVIWCLAWDLYQVFLQVEGAQQTEVLETSEAPDAIQRQIKRLQTPQILQAFNLLQTVSPLSKVTRREIQHDTNTCARTYVCVSITASPSHPVNYPR